MAKTGLFGWLRGKDQASDTPETEIEIEESDIEQARVAELVPVVALSERFLDEGEIAAGGMGSIHSVLDRNLLRRNAMKILKDEHAGKDREARRFIEEAQITGQLDHPNIVPVHELGVDENGALYFTMKMVSGQNLAQLLHAARTNLGDPGRVRRFLEIFVKVCDAIAFAHSRGVIHRDLKPSNIMVGSFGQVYVMDWGLAKLMRTTDGADDSRASIDVTRDLKVDELDGEGVVIGSVRYMSPEQARGWNKRVDERSDVFALGALLYHILTGRPPYELVETNAGIKLAQHANIHDPESVVPPGTHLPRFLCDIAMRALKKEPTDRYPSVTTLKSDVELYLRGGAPLPRHKIPKGTLLVREGDVADTAYIIATGCCQAYKTVDGTKVVLRKMGPGEVFGETAILSASRRSASVEALEDVEVMEVTARALAEGVGMNSWMGVFVRALAERFREADERLTQLEHDYLTYLQGK